MHSTIKLRTSVITKAPILGDEMKLHRVDLITARVAPARSACLHKEIRKRTDWRQLGL